jgi:putative ABC transport system permease protein
MRRSPRVSLWLRIAAWLLPEDARAEILRELLEQQARRRRTRGRAAAWIWACRQPWAALMARERSRDGTCLRAVGRDLAAGRRALQRRPMLSATVVATMAVGIGSIAAIASVVDAVLLRPLPYPDADRLVWVATYDAGAATPFDPATAASAYANPMDVVDWERRERSFAALTPFETFESTVQAAGRPLRVDVASVRTAVRDVLGVPALHGRLFTDEDAGRGVRVMVMSHRLWRSAFGADPSLVGRRVDLGGEPFELIGVLPDLPVAFPTMDTDVWLPLPPLAPGFSNRGGVWQRVVARLDPGVTIAGAQGDIDRIARELSAAHPDSNADRRVRLVPYREGFVGATDSVLKLVAAAVVIVLLIACANVGHLLLVSAQARQRELAVRAALGADAWRLASLLAAETTWLAAAGGALGLTLAPWLVQAFLRLYPDTLPVAGPVELRFTAVAAAIGATTIAALAAIVPPLANIRGTRGRRLQSAMRSSERGSEHRAQRRVRAALVVTQVALSTALLLGGGLLLRTFWTMRGIDPGFQAGGVLTFNLALGERTYPTLADEVRFYDSLLAGVRALPGVESAGATTLLPLTPGEFGDGFYRVGFDDVYPDIPIARLQNVTAGYLEAVGLPLRKGRVLQLTDTASSPRVVVVNETLERQYFPEGAIGRQIRFRGEIAAIVGVVGDKQHRSLRERPRADMYFPRSQVAHPRLFGWVAIRAAVDPGALLPAVRDLVGALDPGVAFANVDTMARRLDAALAPDRFRAYLVGALALAALLLSGLGLYGLIAFMVARDTRDIAIRMALGASAGRTVAQVVRVLVWLTAAGVAAGFAVAFAARALVARFLVGVTPFDPLTTAVVAFLLLAVAALAAAGPATRASRVDPATVLRSQ